MGASVIHPCKQACSHSANICPDPRGCCEYSGQQNRSKFLSSGVDTAVRRDEQVRKRYRVAGAGKRYGEKERIKRGRETGSP